MATIETVPAEETVEPAVRAPGAPIKLMAMGLWGVVGALLGYGVLQTALKAAALFS